METFTQTPDSRCTCRRDCRGQSDSPVLRRTSSSGASRTQEDLHAETSMHSLCLQPFSSSPPVQLQGTRASSGHDLHNKATFSILGSNFHKNNNNLNCSKSEETDCCEYVRSLKENVFYFNKTTMRLIIIFPYRRNLSVHFRWILVVFTSLTNNINNKLVWMILSSIYYPHLEARCPFILKAVLLCFRLISSGDAVWQQPVGSTAPRVGGSSSPRGSGWSYTGSSWSIIMYLL